jgi:hypothetical protein
MAQKIILPAANDLHGQPVIADAVGRLVDSSLSVPISVTINWGHLRVPDYHHHVAVGNPPKRHGLDYIFGLAGNVVVDRLVPSRRCRSLGIIR